ncbi:hypothetical protein SHIRM173S_06189 [Streptomyces hirsutus]
MRVLRGRSSTTGPAVPFRPLTEALMSLFRSGEPLDDLALGPYRPVLGRLIPDWDTGERESSSMVILGEAVLRLLLAAGRGRGQLLLLEDLHDADPENSASSNTWWTTWSTRRSCCWPRCGPIQRRAGPGASRRAGGGRRPG